MKKPKLIVGIGGTTRSGSSSERLMRAVLARCVTRGAETVAFGGATLAELPHYAPDDPARSPVQQAFVDAVRNADGFVVATPGYHGGISALVKNALDLMEDTRGDARIYLDGCPVGLIVSAAGWQATGATLSALRDVVCALRGWPAPISLAVNSVEQRPFDSTGELTDTDVAAAADLQAHQLLSFERMTA
jgi:FMN reductase